MDYSAVILVSLVLFAWMLVAQWFVASTVKARADNAVPGKIDDNLSHDSFIFRAHRTFQNTLENAPLYIVCALVGLHLGVSGPIFAIASAVFVAARVVHMLLYYVIATESNPSPRSYFFMIGWLANIVMLVLLTLEILFF
ncbi:hypothetical protein W04_3761 [Pseudoalteromonas sp. SW0106-04]|uniref:MAPEG family protein n=1 Tax=Pseudoalteromonas sp. SW0106-04 TaxID=1702169 RepID=UPI0006B5EE5A|nr:MAPEG family protein [Pseudoalteromonas sp. SW0106-04]GAP77176.1 hypothetical protein W04_3761 [Pseudoalteromonas sp. SW0106-04]